MANNTLGSLYLPGGSPVGLVGTDGSAIQLSTPSALANGVLTLGSSGGGRHLNNYAFQNIVSNTSAGPHPSTTSNGLYTLGETWQAEGPFAAVRIVLFNDTNTVSTISGISVYASAKNDGTLIDYDGNPVIPVHVTFNNGGADFNIEQQSAARVNTNITPAYTATIPALSVSSTWTPNLFYSDWMPLLSTKRADGGFGNFLTIRNLIVANTTQRNMPTAASNNSGHTLYNVVPRVQDSWFVSGDYFTGDPAFLTTGNGSGTSYYAIQFLMDRPSLNVMVMGESVFSGWGTPSNVDGFVQLACAAASTANVPVVRYFTSQGAQGYNDATNSAFNLMKNNRVGACIICAWDGNDAGGGSTFTIAKAKVDLQWSLANQVAAQVRLNGGVPIFVSPMPNCINNNYIQEQARLLARQRVLDSNLQGSLVIDVEPILGSMATPPTYSPSITPTVCNSYASFVQSPDGIHPGPPGHAAIANVLAPMLTSIANGSYSL